MSQKRGRRAYHLSTCAFALLESVASAQNRPGCVDVARYYRIDNDIADIAASIDDERDRSHFFGGILRLAAHDFMDHDQDAVDRMGMDGCLDWTSLSNAGLSSVWNEHTPLHHLYENEYSDISVPDFWVAVANAVVRQTSVDNDLDLVNTYYWGRRQRDECVGSASRLPTTEDCRQVEGVFLERMGLRWKDAVALMGAHTLGRGHHEFSGHHGTWVPDDQQAQIFDKRYYQEMVSRAWWPREASTEPFQQDFTTGNHNGSPKMMLNTDICLVFDIDDERNGSGTECCTRTDLVDGDGNSHCEILEDSQCRLYPHDHPRWEATNAVMHNLDGNNHNFYEAFRLAWFKATTNGMFDLHPIALNC